MITAEKEDIDRIKKAFSKIKKDKKLSDAEVDDLMSDTSELIGIYSIDKNNKIASLIQEMLSFGEKNNLVTQGLKLEFERVKKRKVKK